jgi:SPOR domain
MSINRLAAAAMAFVIAGLSGCGERGAKRLPLTGFKVAFESHKVVAQMKSGERVAADVTIKNVSPVSWPSKPNAKNLHAVNLAYHWLDKKGQMVVFDGERTSLPYDLKPGESVTLKAAIHAPEQAGAYILEITLVQEGVAWFPENGGAKLSLPVDVARAVTADAPVSNAAAVKKSAAAAEKRPAPSTLAAKADKPKGERGRHDGPWSVQIGSFPDKKRAEQSAQKFASQGLRCLYRHQHD